MVTTTDRATIDPRTGRVECARCRHKLGVAVGGRYSLRHAGRTLVVEGLTASQSIRIWCEKCGKEQAITAVG